jgi:hypothetical protein
MKQKGLIKTFNSKEVKDRGIKLIFDTAENEGIAVVTKYHKSVLLCLLFSIAGMRKSFEKISEMMELVDNDNSDELFAIIQDTIPKYKSYFKRLNG